MIDSGFITYYWSASSEQALREILFSTDSDGLPVPVMDSLGIAEGNGLYGVPGTFYTCTKSVDIIQTPPGCVLADPYIISNLLGVWA